MSEQKQTQVGRKVKSDYKKVKEHNFVFIKEFLKYSFALNQFTAIKQVS